MWGPLVRGGVQQDRVFGACALGRRQPTLRHSLFTLAPLSPFFVRSKQILLLIFQKHLHFKSRYFDAYIVSHISLLQLTYNMHTIRESGIFVILCGNWKLETNELVLVFHTGRFWNHLKNQKEKKKKKECFGTSNCTTMLVKKQKITRSGGILLNSPCIWKVFRI